MAQPQKEQQQDEGEDPSRTLAVSLDLDALECALCFFPSEASIFQCKNGHAACEACCVHIKGTCPCCGVPTGEIRCRPLEKAIAGMVAPCAFAAHGCAQRLQYAEKRAHEALLCQHAPCACPLPGCAYSGLRLQPSTTTSGTRTPRRAAPVTLRRSSPFRVLLHAVDTRVFLLLNGGDVPSGRSLSVVCLGLRPAGNRALQDKLEVGSRCRRRAPCRARARRWAGHHPTEYRGLPVRAGRVLDLLRQRLRHSPCPEGKSARSPGDRFPTPGARQPPQADLSKQNSQANEVQSTTRTALSTLSPPPTPSLCPVSVPLHDATLLSLHASATQHWMFARSVLC
ncbi:hypothetical protein BS78_03G082000 [Paspalum vaginatum]|nr:hypothetical protein BS78_03G082000 [Paspalum vaginatum]